MCLLLVLVSEDLVELYVRLAEDAAVGFHLRLRLDGVKDGLLLGRLLYLGPLELL